MNTKFYNIKGVFQGLCLTRGKGFVMFGVLVYDYGKVRDNVRSGLQLKVRFRRFITIKVRVTSRED